MCSSQHREKLVFGKLTREWTGNLLIIMLANSSFFRTSRADPKVVLAPMVGLPMPASFSGSSRPSMPGPEVY